MKKILALLLAILAFGSVCTAQLSFSRASVLADGVYAYGAVKSDDDGYATAQILNIDPSKVSIFPALAKPSESLIESVVHFFTPWAKKKRPGFFKSKVSEIASQHGALAGVNGTYFDGQGEPLGVLMIDGRIMSYPIHDRTSLVLTGENKAYIDNIILDAYAQIGDVKYSITGINEARDSQDDIILYTPDFGELTRTNQTGFDIVVENGAVASTRSGNTWIPENGFVLAAGALYAENMAMTINQGDKVEIVVNVIPYSTTVKGELRHLIGGGPRLLKSGRVYISKYEENFRRDISRGRAARTAVGITKDGHLLFVTVDKNHRNSSRGMTLTELAYFLQSLGATDALNLDGGGSTTMVVGESVVNRPAYGSQRRVGNALLVKPRG